MTPEHFTLITSDKASGLWLRLLAHLQSRLADARARNDKPLTELETAALRGEIKCLKSLIALGNDRPLVTGDDDTP